ncbi:MAG TPA: hypothetical protein PLF26_06775, partial [Blastocatellia bacterium]|nr:hypothetical protein [Blastocatellia bacterium]
MGKSIQRVAFVILIGTLFLAGPVSVLAQGSGAAGTPQSTEPGGNWPRTFTSGGGTFSLYHPQVDTWQDNSLAAFSAVGFQASGSNDKTYGVVYFTARTEVDKINRVVTLEDFAITKATFPTSPDLNAQAVSTLQSAIPVAPVFVPLDRLETALAASGGAKGVPTFAVENTPPAIIISTTPAVLVLVDGPPALGPVEKSKLQRV